MNKIFSILICAFLLVSCAEKHDGERKTGLLSNFMSITDNEDAGVKEILEYYGGQCKYSIGTSASTQDGKEKFFELEMSQSDVLEEYRDRISMAASNIAYLFYENLKEERTNYDEIHAVIIFKDGTKKTFEYSTDELELVNNRMSLAIKTVSLITSKNYEELVLLLNNEITNFDKDELIASLAALEPQLEEVKEFLPFGYHVREVDNGMKVLHISGILAREVQNIEFSIDVDLNSKEEKVYYFQFKF